MTECGIYNAMHWRGNSRECNKYFISMGSFRYAELNLKSQNNALLCSGDAIIGCIHVECKKEIDEL